MNSPNISFHEGDEARRLVTSEDLRRLAGVQLNKAPDTWIAHYAQRVHEVLGDTWLGNRMSVYLNQKYNLKRHFHSRPWRGSMEEFFDNGHGIVAKDGEDTVGIVARQYMPQFEGRNVVQMRRMVVDENYRGQHIGTALRERIFASIREESPDAIILNETERPEVIHLSQRMGMTEISMEESYRLKGGRPEDYDAYREWAESELANYKFFKYDPREHQDDVS